MPDKKTKNQAGQGPGRDHAKTNKNSAMPKSSTSKSGNTAKSGKK